VRILIVLFPITLIFFCFKSNENSSDARMDSQNNLKLIKYLLEDSVRYVKELVKLSAEGGEFYAAGPQDRIPWAGTKNGSEVMEQNFRIVLEIMEYEVFDAYEFINMFITTN